MFVLGIAFQHCNQIHSKSALESQTPNFLFFLGWLQEPFKARARESLDLTHQWHCLLQTEFFIECCTVSPFYLALQLQRPALLRLLPCRFVVLSHYLGGDRSTRKVDEHRSKSPQACIRFLHTFSYSNRQKPCLTCQGPGLCNCTRAPISNAKGKPPYRLRGHQHPTNLCKMWFLNCQQSGGCCI